MNRQTIVWMLVGLGVALGVLIGCHAQPDDPAGQAEELADPVRRQNAISNLRRLYVNALASAQRATQDDDRDPRALEEVTNSQGKTEPGPKAIADASIDALVKTYLDHPEDTQNGGNIISLLAEMRDPRALPAFIEALDWRAEMTEDQAVAAARAIEDLEVPAEKKGEVITALSEALDRIQGSRGADNRMRVHFIRTLGDLGDRRATPILTKVATRITEDQSFLINRKAAEQLGTLADPASVPAMIKGLFLFGSNNPGQRMNDLAAQALVRIGEPALQPLLALLAGDNEEAKELAESYIRAIAQRDERAAERMDPRTLVVGEACFALGQLGLRAAIDPMMEQVTPLTSLSVSDATAGGEDKRGVYGRALSCTTSLIQINREASDTPRLRQTIIDVYQRIPESWPPETPGSMRSQLLASSMHTYDVGLLDFLHGVAADREGLPDFRVIATRTYAFLTGKDGVARLRQVIEAEPEASRIRTAMEEFVPALDVAMECDEDLECYIGKLGDDNPQAVRKAAYMIGRFGRGDAHALAALIEHIDHPSVPVRGDVLYAIDWVATEGSPEAVQAIDALREAEEGRSSWNQLSSLAMAVRARLDARSGA